MGLFDFLKKHSEETATQIGEHQGISEIETVLMEMMRNQATADAAWIKQNGIIPTPEIIKALTDRRAEEAVRSIFGPMDESETNHL